MRKAQKEEEEKNRYDDKHEYLHLRILREQQDARQSWKEGKLFADETKYLFLRKVSQVMGYQSPGYLASDINCRSIILPNNDLWWQRTKISGYKEKIHTFKETSEMWILTINAYMLY